MTTPGHPEGDGVVEYRSGAQAAVDAAQVTKAATGGWLDTVKISTGTR